MPAELGFYFYFAGIRASFYDIKNIINFAIATYCVGGVTFCLIPNKRYNIVLSVILAVFSSALFVLNSEWLGEQIFIWRYSGGEFYNRVAFFVEKGIKCFNYSTTMFFSVIPIVLLCEEYRKTKLLMKKNNIKINMFCFFLMELNFIILLLFTPVFKMLHSVSIYDFEMNNYSFVGPIRIIISFFLLVSVTFILYVLLKKELLSVYFVGFKKKIRKTFVDADDLRHVFHTFKNYSLLITTIALKAENGNDNNEKTQSFRQIREIVSEMAEQTSVFININNNLFQSKEKVNLLDCINIAMSRIQKSENLSVKLNVFTDDVYINGSRNSITEMCYNILMNAQDAIEKKKNEDGQIIVSVFDEENYICIKFWDNGCGIDKSIKKDIFKPFVSAKKTFNRWGLGMSHVKSVVKSHYGYIDVESKLGHFTEIQVVFVKYL